MLLDAAQSSMAVHRAPDWETRARSPGRPLSSANVAFRPRDGRWIPRQLGPMKRMPYLCATVRRLSSKAAPSAPTSRNPAVSTTAWRTPRLPQASMMPGTVAAGVAMMARSGVSGSSAAPR